MPKLNYPFEQEPEGIGGWLLVVALWLVVSPIRIVLVLWQYHPILRDGEWALLTTPGTEGYPYQAPLLVFEAIVYMALLVATMAAAVSFFRQSPLFPRFYVGILAVSLVFVMLDLWLASRVRPEDPFFLLARLPGLAGTAVSFLVWVPYMLLSKRVKNTFVDPRRSVRRTATAGLHEAHEGA